MTFQQIRKKGYPVAPKSVREIRFITRKLREMLGINHLKSCPIMSIFELFGIYAPFAEYSLEIVEDNDPVLGNRLAATFPESKTIRVKNCVYEKACQGDGQARFTMTHELGHLLLGHKLDVSFARRLTNANESVPPYRDSEWQADAFAGEFLMPKDVVENMPIEEICKKCRVSYQAAETRLALLQKACWQ